MIVRFSRRKFMAAAGSSTVVLPTLEALQPRLAQAAYEKKLRLVILMTPNGTPQSNWFPTGGETDFVLGPILKPLEEHRKDLLIVNGINSEAAKKSGGDPHGVGMGTIISGAVALKGDIFKHGACFDQADCPATGWGGGVSIDQIVGAEHEKAGAVVHGSLNYAIKNASGSIWTRMSYSGPGEPLTPEANPSAAFDRVFAGVNLTPTQIAQRKRLRLRRQSALDELVGEFQRLQTRISTADRTRLDLHLTAVRKLEQRIARMETLGDASCQVPTRPTLGTGTEVQRNIGGMETNVDPANDADILMRHDIYQAMIIRALACDLTRVTTLIMAPSRADTFMPWLGFTGAHHALSHDGDVPKLTLINNWYAARIGTYLRDLKAEKDETGATLLENTALFWCNELGDGGGHGFDNKPYLIAGQAGGYFKTGRYVKYPNGTPDNVLLTALVQAMGVATTHVGDPSLKNYNINPLRGL